MIAECDDYERVEFEECPDCEGYGKIFFDENGTMMPKWKWDKLPDDEKSCEDCETCGGKGEIEVKPYTREDYLSDLADERRERELEAFGY